LRVETGRRGEGGVAPGSYTLNPQPSTLNPKPQTLITITCGKAILPEKFKVEGLDRAARRGRWRARNTPNAREYA